MAFLLKFLLILSVDVLRIILFAFTHLLVWLLGGLILYSSIHEFLAQQISIYLRVYRWLSCCSSILCSASAFAVLVFQVVDFEDAFAYPHLTLSRRGLDFHCDAAGPRVVAICEFL